VHSQTDLPPLQKLEEVWLSIRQDKDGARALKTLKKAGFDLESIGVFACWPGPYTWPGMIACIPYLPNRRARSSRQPQLRSARPVIAFLREMARATQETYANVEVHDKRKHILYGTLAEEIRHPRLEEAANVVEWVFTKRWVVTHHNPRQNAIASLLWEIRFRTKKPHYQELIDLIDAAFRAAGRNGFPMELEALKKVESHDHDTRVAARRKLIGPGFHL
jgi:hypothetical protein